MTKKINLFGGCKNHKKWDRFEPRFHTMLTKWCALSPSYRIMTQSNVTSEPVKCSNSSSLLLLASNSETIYKKAVLILYIDFALIAVKYMPKQIRKTITFISLTLPPSGFWNQGCNLNVGSNLPWQAPTLISTGPPRWMWFNGDLWCKCRTSPSNLHDYWDLNASPGPGPT